MPQTNTRYVGGNTVMYQNGKEIAWLQSMTDTPPTPVGEAVVVQPHNARRPVEIVTANAVGAGTITLTLIETWDKEAWQHLDRYASSRDILDVFEANKAQGELQLKKLIKTPSGKMRGKIYSGCVVTRIDEGETVNIRSGVKDNVTVTVQYTSVKYVG